MARYLQNCSILAGEAWFSTARSSRESNARQTSVMNVMRRIPIREFGRGFRRAAAADEYAAVDEEAAGQHVQKAREDSLDPVYRGPCIGPCHRDGGAEDFPAEKMIRKLRVNAQ